MIRRILFIILLFFFYSFIGWLMEVIGKLIEKHRFINRGFLIGPVCPIYGCGAIMILVSLTKFKNNLLLLFIMSIVFCSVLEYFTSYIMEKIYGVRWWDYSNKRFNLNGRIALHTMLPFGILSLLSIYYLNPWLEKIFGYFSETILFYVCIVCIVIFTVDFIISFNIINKLKGTIESVEKDATEEISIKVKRLFQRRGTLYKRLINAFPNFKNQKEYLLGLQKNITKRIKKLKQK